MPRFSKSRRTALAGSAALVLGAGVVAGVAQAQQQSNANALELMTEPGGAQADVVFFTGEPGKDLGERRQDWLKAVAGKLGVAADKLDQAIQDVSKEQGMLPPPLLMPLPAGGPGTFQLRIDTGLTEAAKALGMSEDELKKATADGKSLADVAKARGVDPKIVADALRAGRKSQLDAAVAAGKLPKDIADRLTAHLDEEIDHLVQLPGFAARGIFRFERSVVTGTP